jgi:hypothetical protein
MAITPQQFGQMLARTAMNKGREPKVEQVTPHVITDEERLNKTERAYLAFLRLERPGRRIGIQEITIKLAFDCRFTPDFSFFGGDTVHPQFVLDDVKGFQREDALIKARMAAHLFPEWVFRIVFKEGNGWRCEVVKP